MGPFETWKSPGNLLPKKGTIPELLSISELKH